MGVFIFLLLLATAIIFVTIIPVVYKLICQSSKISKKMYGEEEENNE